MEIKKVLSEVVPLNPHWKICYKSKNWNWKVELCCLKIRVINKTVTWNIFFFSFSITNIQFITWIKLLSKQLGMLISGLQNHKKNTSVFRETLPKVHTIIDCTEIYTETPSSLDSHCLLWSDYKHHTTIKILISIIPNGVIHFLGFPLHMVGELQMLLILLGSGFLDLLEPLMAV